MSYNNATMPISLTSYKKLNPDSEFIPIKLYPVSKEINSINNSAQRLSNNVKLNDSGLGNEKNIISTPSNFSAFLNSYLHNAFIAVKNVENALQQAKLQSANLYSAPFDVIREKEPIYHVPNDDIEKQLSVNNGAHYSVIGAELNNDEVYYYAQGYAKVGEEAHIYDEIDYAAVGEETHIYEAVDGSIVGGEPIYEEIDNYTREAETEHLNSKKEINLTKPNDLSPAEKKVFTEVALNKERTEIAELAKQTFAPAKSFISRLASSIWNALFGAKNEAEIVSPAELVARAMRVNIGGICHALNKAIATENVDGIFRQMPNNAIYKKDDAEKLFKAFNNNNCYSDPIALAWMVKLYIDQNMPKITIEEFDTIKEQKPEQLACLIKEKIDQVNCNKTKDNLKACFNTIGNVLKLGKGLESNGDKNNPFSSVNIIGLMLTGLIKQPEQFVAEEFVAKQLDSEGFSSEKFAVKASYDKEFASKLNAAKEHAERELINYGVYINSNKNEISNLIGNTLINS